ncbi:hypothetical protein GCM10009555_106660 [Acrocarpospora macrocephala]|uniref:Uncharacterized protein n=1 Tax=Acrocarpospora macrocephala TaxID=150177 RepID=A0A5M3X307_9ACTN|nr:hypothetical protein [Acrocarpospora macrocephala]GES15410.1 hypothetical protein Amac_090070 [Acrocarpospora macrocephala]
MRELLPKLGLVALIVLGSLIAAAGVVFATGGPEPQPSVKCPSAGFSGA